jgi:hypothetical protein
MCSVKAITERSERLCTNDKFMFSDFSVKQLSTKKNTSMETSDIFSMTHYHIKIKICISFADKVQSR